MSHICTGDSIDPTHDCSCAEGHDHSAAWHRRQIRERRELDVEFATIVGFQDKN